MWKVVVLTLVVLILMEEFTAQQSRPRNNRRNRNRNRNRGNRNRNRAGGRGRAPRRRCEAIQVAMCKGLIGYTHTKLPNRFNHTTQLQVYRVLEHLWAQIDTGCSQNFRLLACSLYLPRCAGRAPPREPCRKTCKQTQRACQPQLEDLGYSWPESLQCNTLPKRRCLKPGPHNACRVQYTTCRPIDLPLCQAFNSTFTYGMAPNMFGQCNQTEIAMEMEQFRPLVESGCSAHMGLFLCGVYMPFCTHSDGGITFICREFCQQVRTDCQATYSTMTRGLPWPNKFQCHRYPPASDTNYTCVMPDQGATTPTLT